MEFRGFWDHGEATTGGVGDYGDATTTAAPDVGAAVGTTATTVVSITAPPAAAALEGAPCDARAEPVAAAEGVPPAPPLLAPTTSAMTDAATNNPPPPGPAATIQRAFDLLATSQGGFGFYTGERAVQPDLQRQRAYLLEA